ncbi:PepSY domain-containing protein [Actinomadura algeriensis]|uniref:Membrane protein YkoI n=1 Tax=Actinomadura algeriensis TaxID=1679523 RepID=A0ABR9JJC9_9ACTN|nr:PepSY domain-containing protein [Actinomadura algeriensis]MBE1530538.1 putative membrane protein YkoI [Actinomadura algeriensis]
MRGLAAALAAVVALSACGGGDDPETPGASATAETLTAPNTTPLPVTTPADGALERAAATALKAAPGGTLTSIETEGPGWEVQVVTADGTEHELFVTGPGTQVVRSDVEREERADRDEHLERIRRAKLNYRDAADAIRASVAGSRISELDLDTVRGTVVWEGDVTGPDGARHALTIDARTGRVLRR